MGALVSVTQAARKGTPEPSLSSQEPSVGDARSRSVSPKPALVESEYRSGDNVRIVKSAKKELVNKEATIEKYLRVKKKWGLLLQNGKRVAMSECFLQKIEPPV